MRFLTAIFAIAIVIIGSSFKPWDQKLFYVLSKSPVSSQPNFKEYIVLQYDELSEDEQNTIACDYSLSATCSFELDMNDPHFHIDMMPEPQDYFYYNVIRLCDNGRGQSKVYHVRTYWDEEIWQEDPRIELVDYSSFTYTPDNIR